MSNNEDITDRIIVEENLRMLFGQLIKIEPAPKSIKEKVFTTLALIDFKSASSFILLYTTTYT